MLLSLFIALFVEKIIEQSLQEISISNLHSDGMEGKKRDVCMHVGTWSEWGK